ncbi:INO80 complex subunit E [Drosophila grimshawi]|uniref:GH20557 n=1 Tax=Drosophila grimshawi TaxID=7222 RepID=B4J8B1_DROGR|nr:INO80 complex subunit E [Drosophila grimshawi]EDW01248.1 GH20557 [Drosophila grimshawi]
MLEGWYCRSLANETTTAHKTERQHLESDDDHLQTKQSATVPGAAGPVGLAESSSASTGTEHPSIDYKERYRNLKRKLKFLIYENEYFQDLLHTNQRRLLKVSRDRSFLIDRLLLYEKPAKDSSDSDATDSSNSDAEPIPPTQSALDVTKESVAMRRKHKDKIAGAKVIVPPATAHAGPVAVGGATRGRRRKNVANTPQQPGKKPIMAMATATVSPSVQQQQHQQQHQLGAKNACSSGSVTMSTAEITRQLQERRPTPIELMSPECASATVPVTMLSDESPSKIYPNESLQHLMEDDSPSHVAAEECVPMVYTN